MANFIFGTSWYAPSNYYVSTTTAGFPGSAAYDYRHPYRPWKGTAATNGTITGGTASEWVGYDLGSSVAPVAAVIDNCNVTTVKIVGATNSAFSTSVIKSNTITLTADPADGKYKAYLDHDNEPVIGGSSKRYWRIENVGTVTTDGDEMRVGSLSFFGTITEWSENLGETYEEEFQQEVRFGSGIVGGSREPKVVGNPGCTITIGGSFQSLGLRSSVLDILRLSEGVPFMFYRNQGTTSQVYIVHRVGRVVVSQPGVNHIRVQRFAMEEVR